MSANTLRSRPSLKCDKLSETIISTARYGLHPAHVTFARDWMPRQCRSCWQPKACCCTILPLDPCPRPRSELSWIPWILRGAWRVRNFLSNLRPWTSAFHPWQRSHLVELTAFLNKCTNIRDSFAILPPDTGPSTKLTPDFSASFAKVWETNGSVVLLSISRVSLFAELKARNQKQEEDRALNLERMLERRGGDLLTLTDHF